MPITAYYRSMKNVINLQHYYLPGELEREIELFVKYYDNHMYHKLLDNLTPADSYLVRNKEILSLRDKNKYKTKKVRRLYNLENEA